MTTPTGTSDQIGPASSFFGGQNQIQGAFIAGVAPTSHHDAIKVWQKHHRYDQWEFIGLDMGVFGVQVGLGNAAAAPAGVGQQSPQQSSGFSMGTAGTGSSPASPSPNY
jgi:hypothetical protein